MSPVLKSGWFYIICVLVLVMVSGLIYHKCQIDSLKDNNQQMLEQLLKSSDYQTKQLTDTISAVQTIGAKQISPDFITEKLKEQLDKYNLESVYAAQVAIQASLSQVIDGQSGATTIIPRPSETTTTPSTTGTTTAIVRPTTHGSTTSNPNNGSHSVNPVIPSNNQPSPTSINVCNECLAANVIRVPFSIDQDFLHVSGYTDSGPHLGDPGQFHLDVSWIKKINLSIALAQDSSGNWSTLIDSQDPDVDISRIQSEVNNSPNAPKWWENIQLGGGLGFGESGVLLGVLAGYKILDHMSIDIGWTYLMPFTGTISDYNQNAFYSISAIGNL